MIGLRPGTVHLSRYTAAWKAAYQRERRRLRRCFPEPDVRIEHVGSTAIPGVDAKPIIDIAIRVQSFRSLKSFVSRMIGLGYEYKGEFGLAGRHFFVNGNPVTHHVHLVRAGSEHWDRWILFRDYLRAHPEEAKRYNAVKRGLARQFANKRDAYTRAKTPFIERVLRLARQERGTEPKIVKKD